MLVKAFGPEHLQLAEDVVQESLAKALKIWPETGIPANPSAWMTLTAKNLALDHLRRAQLLKRKQIDMFGSLYRWSSPITEDDFENFGQQIDDAVLRLMFVCCHPDVPETSRAPLALKSICGLTLEEIARGFRITADAAAKRITRGRTALNAGNIQADLPVGEPISDRYDEVHRTLYLLFNEGYKASSGEALVKADLCAEAIRLAEILERACPIKRPQSAALLALMYFHSARHSTRLDDAGNLLILRHQDRSKWDGELISKGLTTLERAAGGQSLESIQIEATIAALHSTAKSYSSTDWLAIADLYQMLLVIKKSPVARLNFAVAKAESEGPAAGLECLRSLANEPSMANDYLYHAVHGDFLMRVGRFAEAASEFGLAVQLAPSSAERAFLQKQLSNLPQIK